MFGRLTSGCIKCKNFFEFYTNHVHEMSLIHSCTHTCTYMYSMVLSKCMFSHCYLHLCYFPFVTGNEMLL